MMMKQVLKGIWEGYFVTFLHLWPLFCILLLVIQTPVPILGKEWWPLWFISLGLSIFCLYGYWKERKSK